MKMTSMKGGNVEGSYANNSGVQALVVQSVVKYLEEAVDSLRCPPSEEDNFTIADLGCSSGKNSLNIVDYIISRVKELYESRRCEAPEFQVFLSDLASNDFNTLFNLLPPCEAASQDQKCRDYFVAGVPGSFYGRLFPSKSINMFYSTFAVHWLSQVPPCVADSRLPSYNKERVFVHGASSSTGAAYKEQFRSDFNRFLEARVHELKQGGVVFFVCVGRISVDPTDQGAQGLLFATFFQDAWNDLVQEGLIESEKRDSFNIPVYTPTVEELKEAIEANGSFDIRRLEIENSDLSAMNIRGNASKVAKLMADNCQTLLEVLVESHIGREKAGMLFLRAREKAEELKDRPCLYHIACTLSLI